MNHKSQYDGACPLCGEQALFLYFKDNWRSYFGCGNCALVHVPASQHLSQRHERAHYELHDNDPSDLRYRNFLKQLSAPLIAELGEGATRSKGLDFGCGPGPTLALMFQEEGIACEQYDPFFADNKSVLKDDYDFITLSEVAEHLVYPQEEFAVLWNKLNPKGWLAILTSAYPDKDAFADWYYRRDPTHICFYASTTFLWLAKKLGAKEYKNPSTNVFLLKKP